MWVAIEMCESISVLLLTIWVYLIFFIYSSSSLICWDLSESRNKSLISRSIGPVTVPIAPSGMFLISLNTKSSKLVNFKVTSSGSFSLSGFHLGLTIFCFTLIWVVLMSKVSSIYPSYVYWEQNGEIKSHVLSSIIIQCISCSGSVPEWILLPWSIPPTAPPRAAFSCFNFCSN